MLLADLPYGHREFPFYHSLEDLRISLGCSCSGAQGSCLELADIPAQLSSFAVSGLCFSVGSFR